MQNFFKSLTDIKFLGNQLRETFVRFPFALLAFYVATVMGIFTISLDSSDGQRMYQLWLILGILVIFGFLSSASSLVVESLGLKKLWYFGIQGVLAVLAIGYYFLWPGDFASTTLSHWLSLSVLLGVGFGCNLVAPYMYGRSSLGLWRFVRDSLIWLFFCWVCALVLHLGFSLILTACNLLLKVNLGDGRIYAQVWFGILGFVTSTLVLAGVRRDFAVEPNPAGMFLKVLKYCVLFVLLPIGALYTLILYIYLGQILLTQNWPSGQVVWLTLACLLPGLISTLLIYPLWETSKTIKILTKVYFAATLPLLGMYFVAISWRFNDFGITESRYYVVLLGVWLTLVFGYLLFTKARRLKLLPLSLFVLLLLSLVGPWSAVSVSEMSQYGRLEKVLKDNQILVNNKIQKAPKALNQETAAQVTSLVDYLVRTKKTTQLKQWAGLTSLPISDYQATSEVLDKMGIEYTYSSIGPDMIKQVALDTSFSFHLDERYSYSVGSYDIYLPFHSRTFKSNAQSSDVVTLTRSAGGNQGLFTARYKNQQATVDLTGAITRNTQVTQNYNLNEYALPENQLSFKFDLAEYTCKAVFTNIDGHIRYQDESKKTIEQLNIYQYDGVVFCKGK
jgi:hypothetical protein